MGCLMSKTIALFGGSFNPPHLGHLQFTQHILHACSVIDEVWICPCNQSRYGKGLLDPKHRLNMCELTFKHPKVKICDWEIKNKTSGETYKLMQKFFADPEFIDYNFYFAIGMDNAIKAPSWANWDWLRSNVNFLVIPRKGVEKPTNCWFMEPPHIFAESADICDISSTQLKVMLTNNDESCTKYIELETLKYLKRIT